MIADEIASVLPQLQAQAESLMVDTCTITREGEGWVVDPDTGREVPAPPTTVYEGKCKVQTYEPHERTPDVGGSTEVIQRYHVHVPVTAGPFEVGDVVTITSGANDPTTSGRTFRVAGLHEKTWQTAQRLLVDEGA